MGARSIAVVQLKPCFAVVHFGFSLVEVWDLAGLWDQATNGLGARVLGSQRTSVQRRTFNQKGEAGVF